MNIRSKLRNWLGVQDPIKPIDLRPEFLDLEELVKHTMTKFSEVECSNCHKLVVTYPMGGGYYRLFDGTILCSDCNNKVKK